MVLNSAGVISAGLIVGGKVRDTNPLGVELKGLI
jgi:hypothetical protein